MKIASKIQKCFFEHLQRDAELWRGGLHGFERETFRLETSTGMPASSWHNTIFPSNTLEIAQQIERFKGSEADKRALSELLPKALTMDFSDQQIELVTQPRLSIDAAVAEINLLLRFVAGELSQLNKPEMLWPFSMPPIFSAKDLSVIRTANFTDDVDAEYKESYRKQLLLRYGNAKQCWTGVHYNFSLDLRLFKERNFCACSTYSKMARNLWRNFWILELLYGCVTNLSPFYVYEVQEHLRKGGVTLAKPSKFASSLHSHFGYGYRSTELSALTLDYTNSRTYWRSVKELSNCHSRFFTELGIEDTRLLQDSRELYTPFRLKQLHARGNERCEEHGNLIDYIELRILDIDPIYSTDQFSGIYQHSVYLSHLLMVHSALLEAPSLRAKELVECMQREQYILSSARNVERVSKYKPEVRCLLEELAELRELLDFPAPYSDAIEDAMTRLETDNLRCREVSAYFAEEIDPEALYQHARNWTNALQSFNEPASSTRLR